MASSYANLEFMLRETLGELLGTSPRARAVADDLSTEQVIAAMRRALLADPGEGPLLGYARWVLSAASKAGQERAEVAHSSWYLVEHHRDGERLSGLPDPNGGSFDAAGDFDALIGSSDLPIIGSLDPYGDATLDAMTMRDLITDVDEALQGSRSGPQLRGLRRLE